MSIPSGPVPHRTVSGLRSPTSTLPGAPATPSTPTRNISSAFGSPSALRAEEDVVILEIGSRFLRAGLAGDPTPKAVVDFGPDEQTRAGDCRRWNLDYEKSWRKRSHRETWGEAYELWRPDLRGLDLGLVGDKIDRAVRDIFTKHLLIDSRPRRITLALPSTFPLPLLSTILDTLFTSFQPPSVSLLSAPILTCIAAGVRSGLVVDIGWSETVVTGIYEFREIRCSRSIRATKMLGEATFKLLSDAIDEGRSESEDGKSAYPSFDECEEVMARVTWCKPATRPERAETTQGLAPVNEEDELRSSIQSMHLGEAVEADPKIYIPLKSINPPRVIQLPFSELAQPCENAWFAKGIPELDLDDEELPLHLLIYRGLLKLPVDVRSVCMSRLIFVGGGSKVPGLKSRILDEVVALIEQRGWNPKTGRAMEQFHSNSKLHARRLRRDGPTEVSQNPASIASIDASLLEQEYDSIEAELKREASKRVLHTEAGYLRAVESLGAWSGGSLLSYLKMPAISIVDREQWQQHGLAGASRHIEVDVDIAKKRQSMVPGAMRSGDRSSWTLGLWG